MDDFIKEYVSDGPWARAAISERGLVVLADKLKESQDGAKKAQKMAAPTPKAGHRRVT